MLTSRGLQQLQQSLQRQLPAVLAAANGVIAVSVPGPARRRQDQQPQQQQEVHTASGPEAAEAPQQEQQRRVGPSAAALGASAWHRRPFHTAAAALLAENGGKVCACSYHRVLCASGFGGRSHCMRSVPWPQDRHAPLQVCSPVSRAFAHQRRPPAKPCDPRSGTHALPAPLRAQQGGAEGKEQPPAGQQGQAEQGESEEELGEDGIEHIHQAFEELIQAAYELVQVCGQRGFLVWG